MQQLHQVNSTSQAPSQYTFECFQGLVETSSPIHIPVIRYTAGSGWHASHASHDDAFHRLSWHYRSLPYPSIQASRVQVASPDARPCLLPPYTQPRHRPRDRARYTCRPLRPVAPCVALSVRLPRADIGPLDHGTLILGARERRGHEGGSHEGGARDEAFHGEESPWSPVFSREGPSSGSAWKCPASRYR